MLKYKLIVRMNIENYLKKEIEKSIFELFGLKIDNDKVIIIPTKKEFKGNFTFTCFSFSKQLKSSPQNIADKIGGYLKKNCSQVDDYNVISGFLNISISNNVWKNILKNIHHSISPKNNQSSTITIEFPSPNTNKPLHLGHLRNIFLGSSISNILEFLGNKVYRVNLINNRGVHICKSMLAYSLFGNNETPSSSGMKGDHLVGKYYVRFEQELKKQIIELENKFNDKDMAKKEPTIIKQVQEVLVKWENKDKETLNLWNKMNSWVYEGFNETFDKLGIKFDKVYYESDTYLGGKKVVDEGLEKKYFYKKEDSSVWIDLQDKGLDSKLLLRSDGTSVYMTQDIGASDIRYNDFKFDKSIYIVGNEQDYHFKVLFEIMKKLKRKYAEGLFHLSYGMVDLPTGKMKSREGTVVDADNLIELMITTAKEQTEKLGKIENFTKEQSQSLFKTLAMGALKYFILKVDPKKRILFDPKASIDFQGDTGPFIQYTFARISSILKKAMDQSIDIDNNKNLFENINFSETEKNLILHLYTFEKLIIEAGNTFSPSIISHYVFNLSKLYSKFYAEVPILTEPDNEKRKMRLYLSNVVSKFIKLNLNLLGIESPEQM